MQVVALAVVLEVVLIMKVIQVFCVLHRTVFARAVRPAGSQTNSQDFRGLDSSRLLILRGGIYQVRRELPRNSDSEILCLRILSMRADRRPVYEKLAAGAAAGASGSTAQCVILAVPRKGG